MHVTCMPINIFLNAIIRHVNPYSVRLVKLLSYKKKRNKIFVLTGRVTLTRK